MQTAVIFCLFEDIHTMQVIVSDLIKIFPVCKSYKQWFSFPRLMIFLLCKMSLASSNQQLSLVQVLKILSSDSVRHFFLIHGSYREGQPSKDAWILVFITWVRASHFRMLVQSFGTSFLILPFLGLPLLPLGTMLRCHDRMGIAEWFGTIVKFCNDDLCKSALF